MIERQTTKKRRRRNRRKRRSRNQFVIYTSQHKAILFSGKKAGVRADKVKGPIVAAWSNLQISKPEPKLLSSATGTLGERERERMTL